MPQDFPFKTPPMSAPPITPEPMTQPPERSTWPTVVGILAIVFGVLGIFWAAYGLVSHLFVVSFSSWMPPEQAAEMQQIMESTRTWVIVSSCLTLLLAILLLVSGIGVVRRRQGSVRPLRVWAYLKILFAVVTLVMTVMMQRQTLAITTSQPGAGPVATSGVLEEVIITTSALAGLVVSCAGPVFVLVWFSRKSIKAEVADWT